jgi:hypothetical protein
MIIEYAKNPQWANRDQTSINITVKFESINEELPFAANANDPEEYGRTIYAQALNGDFGEIAPFEPQEFTIDQIKHLVRDIRNEKLKTEVDPIVSNFLRWNGLSPEKQKEYEDYRQHLLDITSDPNFPWFNLVVKEDNWGFSVDMSQVPWGSQPNG